MALTRAQLVNPNCQVTDSDYNAIEAAIMESSRGRWFLAEYARRNRHADTQQLLSAINNIKETIDGYKRTLHPYFVRTNFSSTYQISQMRKPQTQQRMSQARPNINNKVVGSDIASSGVTLNACRNEVPSACNQRAPESLCDATDAFVFNY